MGSAEAIHGASDTGWAAAQDVGVNHRRRDISVSKEELNRPDIVAVFQEMGRERVPPMPTSA